jgi:hypothetical protein
LPVQTHRQGGFLLYRRQKVYGCTQSTNAYGMRLFCRQKTRRKNSLLPRGFFFPRIVPAHALYLFDPSYHPHYLFDPSYHPQRQAITRCKKAPRAACFFLAVHRPGACA